MASILDSIGVMAPDDLRVAIKLDMVPGWKHKRKFGRNPDVDAGTEDVWTNGGTRTLPTVAAVASLVSTSTDDDVAGTGAITVKVQGLDANYDQLEETVTLDGTTPSLSTALFLRVDRMHIQTVGTGLVNAGIITASVGGNVQASIDADAGQTLQLMDTVPAGFTFVMTTLVVVGGRTGAADLSFTIQTKSQNGGWRSRVTSDVYEGQVGGEMIMKVSQKTDIRARVTSSGANLNISGVWHGYLVEQVF